MLWIYNKLQSNVMNIKIDTKERFTVITPEESYLSVNMTEELGQLLLGFIHKDIPHIVFNMHEVKTVDELAGEKLAQLQQQFYEKKCSFVICCLQPEAEKLFDKTALLEFMNITPSESEAWDMVQMEEIERELLGDD